MDDNLKNYLTRNYSGKRVLITGHTGFKGTWLSLWLNQLGAKVFGISDRYVSEPNLFASCNMSEITDTKSLINLEDFQASQSYFDLVRPDFVFHLAAQPLVRKAQREPFETTRNNLLANLTILEILRQYEDPVTAVMITSDKSYNNKEWVWGYREHDELGGKDIYSGSKAAAELTIRSYYNSFFSKNSNVRLAVARAGNVIGGGDWAEDRLVPDCFKSWMVNQQLILRNPSSTRPWQHVLEPLSGYLRLAIAVREQRSLNGEVFNFGPNASDNKTVAELMSELKKNWERSVGIEGKYKFQSEASSIESNLLQLNCDKAHALLNWFPIMNFEETASKTVDWYSFFYNEKSANAVRDFTNNQISDYMMSSCEGS